MAWWKLLSNGAAIAEFAKQVYTTLNKDKASAPPPTNDFKDLLLRIDYLEKNEIRQAELVKRMAEQMYALSSRVKTANAIAIISIIIAILSLALQIINK